MGILDSLLGKKSADVSLRASQDTYGKQTAATDALRSYGDTLPGRYSEIAAGYDPYVKAGGEGLDSLLGLLRDPSSVRSLPGYAFDQEEGVKALDRSAAARGGLNSGRQSKDLLRFGTGLADKTFGDQWSRLLGLTGMGQAATGAQAGLEATGVGAQTGARTSAYAGDMASAGTIGQGQVAAESAKQNALQNLLGTAAYLGGSFLGGGAKLPKFG